MRSPQFKKYLIRTFNKGAVLLSEIEIAEGSLAEIREEDRITKPDEIPLVHPEPMDTTLITSLKPFHRELTEIAMKNGGIFPMPPKKPSIMDKLKGFFR